MWQENWTVIHRQNAAIIAGEITLGQIDIILSCLEMGELFIPEQVDLPAKRLEEYEFQPDDTPIYGTWQK